jgi:predicted dehydrogenase
MITAAVIGVGSMGRNHARVYRSLPDVQLVAVADTDPQTAGRIGQLHGVRPYGDFQTMLASEAPEVVSVAVPTESHFEVARECLLAGCHVLVEKPIAVTAAQGRNLVELAGRADRVLMVGHIERFNPAVIEMTRRLGSGQLGQIVYMLGRRLGPPPERRPSCGVVMDLACHDIDMMLHICGGAVRNVSLGTRSVIGGSGEDFATVVLHFSTGVLGVLEASWVTPTKIREFWVTGENGMFVLDYLTQDLYYYKNAPPDTSDRAGAWDALSVLRGGAEGCMTKYGIRKAEPLYVELAAFVTAVRRRDHSLNAARAAVKVMEIVDLIAGSASRANRRRPPGIIGVEDDP